MKWNAPGRIYLFDFNKSFDGSKPSFCQALLASLLGFFHGFHILILVFFGNNFLSSRTDISLEHSTRNLVVYDYHYISHCLLSHSVTDIQNKIDVSGHSKIQVKVQLQNVYQQNNKLTLATYIFSMHI